MTDLQKWAKHQTAITEQEIAKIADNERCFLAAFKGTGIPFRNQELMTRAECRDWIKHDVACTQDCGIDVHEEDYEIIDTRKWRS